MTENEIIINKINIKLEWYRQNQQLVDCSNISDGYHTFWELYKHRIFLFKALCKSIYIRNDLEMQKLQFYKDKVKEWANSKGEIIERLQSLPKTKDIKNKLYKSKRHKNWLDIWNEWGMFLVLVETLHGQISYHIPKHMWHEFKFIPETHSYELPDFDWHTSDDVLDRLLLI